MQKLRKTPRKLCKSVYQSSLALSQASVFAIQIWKSWANMQKQGKWQMSTRKTENNQRRWFTMGDEHIRVWRIYWTS